MLSQKLNIQEEKKFFVIVHEGSPIFKVTKDVQAIASFLGGLSSSKYEVVVKKKVTKKKQKKEVGSERLTKAIQLEKKYTLLKKKFYKRKVMNSTSPSSASFQHFLKAVDMIQEHEVKISQFLKAQIEGLKFVDGGLGVFPKVNQLSTASAEQRLLDYLRQKHIEVELTDIERQTELQQNKKYVSFYEKIKKNTASLFEASYVRACQLARRGETQGLVEEYIKQLKK